MADCELPRYNVILSTDGRCRAVFDGRIGFELNKGYAITFEFATVDVVEIWPTMTLPNTPGLAEKVTAMQSPNIRINFTFDEPVQNTES